MADAYDKVVKRVNEANESVLAELIARDVQQLTERALGPPPSPPTLPPTHSS